MPHDHPRPFVTIVLRGGYEDWVRCPRCNGKRVIPSPLAGLQQACPRCGELGLVLGERLRAGSLRVRRAEHAHMTRTDDRGAWTIVVMGPERRPWGFWRNGQWWPRREFEQRFGFAWRCDEPTVRLPGTTSANRH